MDHHIAFSPILCTCIVLSRLVWKVILPNAMLYPLMFASTFHVLILKLLFSQVLILTDKVQDMIQCVNVSILDKINDE